MSLFEELKTLSVLSEEINVRGHKLIVTGLVGSELSAIQAACRNGKGEMNFEKLQNRLLERCVKDPEGRSIKASEWPQLPQDIRGGAVASVMRVNGMDNDDLRIKDPKDSDSTES